MLRSPCCSPLWLGMRATAPPSEGTQLACLCAGPVQDGSDYLGLQLVKVQDTVPIHSAVISQKVALGALAAGRPWLDARMQALRQNRWLAPPLASEARVPAMHRRPTSGQRMLQGPSGDRLFCKKGK